MGLAANEKDRMKRLLPSVALPEFNKVKLLFSWNDEIIEVWEAQD